MAIATPGPISLWQGTTDRAPCGPRHLVSGENYRDLRDALDRLAGVRVTIDGYDVETGTFRDNWIAKDEKLVHLGRPKSTPSGLDRPSIKLADWLRDALADDKVVRVHCKTLRAFDERHKLAKRLWLYLAAERWKRTSSTTEGLWIACGDRLEAALGMDYERPRAARAALKRASHTIQLVDPRYSAGSLDVVQLGRSWRVQAERPNWETWKAGRQEQLQVRDLIHRSLNDAKRNSRDKGPSAWRHWLRGSKRDSGYVGCGVDGLSTTTWRRCCSTMHRMKPPWC